MNESITPTTNHFTACATLAAIGANLKQLDLFGPIKTRVQIKQKTIKHTPVDKLYDAFIAILAGAHGLVEVNTRLRSDVALQQAFGRTSCAEQSTIQDTLNSCTADSRPRCMRRRSASHRLTGSYRSNRAVVMAIRLATPVVPRKSRMPAT